MLVFLRRGENWGEFMTRPAIHKPGLPVSFISLMVGLLVILPLPMISSAKAETIRSITFRVPVDVSNIHKDIRYLAPMCRIFKGNVASNANQIGAARPDIAVPASRHVSRKVAITITRANLSPGNSLDNTNLYTCTLYVKKSANGPLLSYALTSADPATRAIGAAPRNVAAGSVVKGRRQAVLINTTQLKARGTYRATAPSQPTVRAAPRITPGRVGGSTGTETTDPARPGVNRNGAQVVGPNVGIAVDRRGQEPKPGVNRNGAQAAGPNVGIAVDRRVQGPEPVVTNWYPQDIAHPGQTLVIEGRDFKPRTIVVQLQGQGNRAINLKVQNATATRIEAAVTDFDYTGHVGAKLVVFQRGGQQKVLDEDYKIVGEDITFKGDSLWRVGPNAANNIFTTGDVTLTLRKFEFRESGSGQYREKVALVKRVSTQRRPCKGIRGDHIDQIYDFKDMEFEKNVAWRKLTDGRIEIRGIGINGLHTATGQVIDGIFSLQYIIPLNKVRPSTTHGKCNGIGVKIGKGLRGGRTAQLRAAPERLVEWSLRRTNP